MSKGCLRNRIVIVVDGGIVKSVYSEDKDVTIEVIDCDTDDPVFQKEIDEELDRLHEDTAKKKLKCVF